MTQDIKITSKAQLIHYMENGCKTKADWSIGMENEQFVFQMPEQTRAPYEGPRGINALLTAFQKDGWEPLYDKENVIALKKNGANISLEPAGQFELSGATLKTLHAGFDELCDYHKQLYAHLKKLDLGLLSQGLDPKTHRKDMPWMPKQRYGIMRAYMPTKGSHGLDMMTATATVQVNLDYSSQEDCGKKFRVAMALQPLVTAMFANSPIHEGKLSGFKSFRGYIWTDTDPDRSGLLPFAFEKDFSFEKYVDYVLDTPMYFVYRDGIYHNHAGHSFRDFMKGELPGMIGELPTLTDFEDHMTTVFPEVRLKKYIEMRGADNGSIAHMMALSAFWTGLLYDEETLDEIYAMVLPWTFQECQQLKEDVIRTGLQANFRNHPLHVTADIVLELAKQGLKNRACLNQKDQDETIYLVYLDELLKKHQCPADELIKTFRTDHASNVESYLKHHIHQGPEDHKNTDPWDYLIFGIESVFDAIR